MSPHSHKRPLFADFAMEDFIVEKNCRNSERWSKGVLVCHRFESFDIKSHLGGDRAGLRDCRWDSKIEFPRGK